MGQQYVEYNPYGQIVQVIDSSVQSLPTKVGLLAVSDAQAWLCLNMPGWSVVSGALVAPNNQSSAAVLASLQALWITTISTACQDAIYAGFSSSALGAAYTYPAKATDQQNLTASIAASLFPGLPNTWTTPFWCADINGLWEFRPHSAAQIQQVGIDAKNAIVSCMAKNQTLCAQVQSATTIDAVYAVVWS